MKRLFFLFAVLFSMQSAFSQNQLNDYKYIVIPAAYDFLGDTDQYRLNSLTRFLFKKDGFEVLSAGEQYPQDLAMNQCLALKADVEKQSGFLVTKLVIHLKDCQNNIVYSSAEGKSREKDFKAAYQAALKDAYKSIQALDYKYSGKEMVLSTPTQPQVVVKEEVKKPAPPKPPVVKETTQKPAPVKPSKPSISAEKSGAFLYAQPTATGYQLVDSTPKIVYILQRTGKENVYLLKNKNGIVYNRGGKWIVEYYEGDTQTAKVVDIKF